MDEATYKIIGAGYSEVAEKEAWCTDVDNVADVALLTLESLKGRNSEESKGDRTGSSDAGAVRMLLEGKFLFDVVDQDSDFEPYKVLILPDHAVITPSLQAKLEAYFAQGGRVLATGRSGLNESGDEFAISLGVRWCGESPYKPDYFRPGFELPSLGSAAFIFYSQGQKVELSGGAELGFREHPYFNRDVFTFCSHQHTPNALSNDGPGMVESANGIYFAWNVFEDYATKGSLALKECVVYALNKLLGSPTLQTSLPAQGITTLMKQTGSSRFINHLLYASPVKRGNGVEVIEDILPVYNVDVTLRLSSSVKRVYLAPQMTDLPYEQANGTVRYTLPKLECHQMVVLDI